MTNIYKGTDVHAYTIDIKQRINDLPDVLKGNMKGKAFDDLIKNLKLTYRSTKTESFFLNIEKSFTNNRIQDPELPNINFALVLSECWNMIQLLYPEARKSFINFFEETITQIGGTCVQGISHRLLSDYFVLIDTIKNNNKLTTTFSLNEWEELQDL